MELKIFGNDYLDELTAQARSNPRKRQHRNLHASYEEPCQRLFNAIELGSYIRPHRHATDPKDELLIAVRGLMALITFDDCGKVTGIVRFGSCSQGEHVAVGAEVPANSWHTVVALVSNCVLLEVKAGPFDPAQPKDLAPWAPEEEGGGASDYLSLLIETVSS